MTNQLLLATQIKYNISHHSKTIISGKYFPLNWCVFFFAKKNNTWEQAIYTSSRLHKILSVFAFFWDAVVENEEIILFSRNQLNEWVHCSYKMVFKSCQNEFEIEKNPG